MNTQQKEVCKNILYAVETGGQVYGKHEYTAFVPAFTVSDGETAITIGAGQWLGGEAKRLLQLIRSTDKAGFEKLDTAGIGNDLDTADWNNYRVQKTSAKATCIKKIIGSETGIQCQDQLMLQQIDEYEQKITATYGEMSAGGMIECINITHQGGSGALKRILAKTVKPYTAASIYAALCTDPDDRSNDNQVGDYVSRQKAVYSMIVTYLKEGEESTTMTENELRQKVVTTAEKYLGCNEADGSHRRIIDIYNTKQKQLPRGYKVTYSDAWCATFVSAISILCGLTDIMPTECGCGAMVDLYVGLGRWQENDGYTPQPGDIIMYYWKDGTNYETTDCVGYPDHVGIVVSVSGKTIKVIEGNKNDAVGYREIKVNGRYIRGYCLPNYALKAGTVETTPEPADNTKIETNSTGTIKNKVLWEGAVTANGGLAVRTWAGTEYGECSFSPLKTAEVVGVCDQLTASDGAIWYFIKYNGKYGFVHSRYISKIVAEQAAEPSAVKQVAFAKEFNPSTAGAYKITANALYLRYEPGKITDDNVVDVIKQGQTVHNYGYYTKVNGVVWLLVAYKNMTGYVSGTYVRR